MAWLQASALGHAMRDTGVWTYALVNLTHILGVSTLFGAVIILDLRLLGVWKRIPLAPLSDAASRLALIGFLVAASSGLGLLATKATEYVGNPFLYVKFPAIGLGLANAIAVRFTTAWKARAVRQLSPNEQRRLAWAGGASLVCWGVAVAAGRLIAYW